MNENAKKWIAALKSGKFQQGRNYLRNADGYCCLGVACELFRRKTGQGKWVAYTYCDKQLFHFTLPGGASSSAFLPRDVQKWLGLRDITGAPIPNSDLRKLTDLNDSLKLPFPEIARHLEEHAEAYFKPAQVT